ncbi:MAG: prephenate dehydrogenase [Candidatus Omnitrophica bacterium]|jgi:prephenate dehydrogenase|nr:prephenate dehydrogenase [Candidatus Omnitrophota bacterium]
MSFKKVSILGVGFMGGSLALATKKTFPQTSVWGYARSRRSYYKLKKLDILDKVITDLKSLIKDADLVILALPVAEIINYLRKIAPFLKENSLVIDLGSSKELIVKKAKQYLPKNIDFIGCHPLCGSEKSGANFSKVDLYQGAICLVTSSWRNKGTKKIKSFWEKLGSKVVFIDPKKHDKILSYMSHLPHLVSFAFMESIPDFYLRFSIRSFKDLTRIAASPASVWADIFLSNKKNILTDLERLNKTLVKFRYLLRENKREKIVNLINKINAKRKNIL